MTDLSSPSASTGEAAAATAALCFGLLLCIISHIFSVVFTGVPLTLPSEMSHRQQAAI